MHKFKTTMMLALMTCIVLISLTYMRHCANATTSFSHTVAGTNDDEKDDSSDDILFPRNRYRQSSTSPFVNHALGGTPKTKPLNPEPASNYTPLMAIFSGVIALGMVYKFGPNAYAKCKNRKQTNA